MRRTLAVQAALDLGGVIARSRGPRVGQPSSPSTLPLGGYADLAAEIRGLGLMRRRPGFYAVLFAGILLALGAVVAGVLLLRDSWWALLLAPVLGVVSTQLGFFGHDAAHRQITRRERPSRWIALVAATC